MKHLLALVALLLASCGGGSGEPQYSTRMDVRMGSAIQTTEAGETMAVLAYRDLSGLQAAIDSAPKWVYIFDEMFWSGRIEIGWREAEIVSAARKVQAAGIRTAVTMLPEVILHPDFALSEPDALDVIGINVYPSLGVDWDSRGCSFGDNLYSTMLQCSVKRLRAAGFTGEIWYVYQAFVTDDPQLEAKLVAQRQTIAQAPAMGVTGLVAYGYDLSSEPPLMAGKGSAFDALVRLD